MNTINSLEGAKAVEVLARHIVKSRSQGGDTRFQLSMLAGVIASVAVTAFVIYKVINEEATVPVGRYLLEDGVFREIKHISREVTDSYIKKYCIAIMPVYFGAVLIFDVLFRKFYIDRKIESLMKYRDRLTYFVPTSPLPAKEIIQLLKIVDRETQISLIAIMNFTQLAQARKVLGKEEFSNAITTGKNAGHSLWREILELKSPLELEKLVTSDNFQAVIKYEPEIVCGIYDLFSGRSQYSEILKRYHLGPNPLVAL